VALQEHHRQHAEAEVVPEQLPLQRLISTMQSGKGRLRAAFFLGIL
jgi:hypothetical protein